MGSVTAPEEMPLLLILMLILLKRAAFDLHAQEIKKPASGLAGQRLLQQAVLERDLAGEVDGTRRAVALRNISKTVECAMQTGVIHERINAAEVRMVEDVQEGGAELEVRFLAQFDALDKGEVSDIRDLIT